MKIYAIFYDNNEEWEDNYYGIDEEHIYLDPKKAKDVCFKLNNPIIIEPTHQEWIDCGWECTWEEFVKDYIVGQKNNGTYTIKELNVS